MAPALLQAAALALRASVATICPVSPTCPQDDQCLYTTNGVTSQVNCGTDYYGGDLSLAQTSTLAGCITACSKTDTCVAASYVNKNCYLKNALNAAQASSDVIGVAVEVRVAAPTLPSLQLSCPANFACPQDNGCVYTEDSRSLTLACSTDYYGGDLVSQYAASLSACTQACAENTQCVAASFVGGGGGGQCYLKDVANSPNTNDNVDAVYLVTAPAQSSSVAASSSSSTPAASSTLVSSSSSPTPSVSISATSSADSSSSSSAAPSMDVSSSAMSSSVSSSSVVISTASAPSSSSESTSTPTPTPTPTSTLPDSSSSVASSTSSATPQSTCGVPITLRNGAKYSYVGKTTSVSLCKAACQSYSVSGNTCRAFISLPSEGYCLLGVGNPPPTISQSFVPGPPVYSYRAYDVSCFGDS